MRLIDPIELKRSIAVSSMIHDGKTLEQIIDAQPTVTERTGKKYRHFKGGIYEVICEAQSTESSEQFVIYKSLDTGSIFVRPKDMFYGYTENGMKRFKEVEHEPKR